VGCVAAAALAVALDQLIRLLESAARKKSRGRGIASLVGLLLLSLVGVAPFLRARTARDRNAGAPVVVGAKTFTEQYVLAELLTLTLKQAGLPAVNRSSLGSTILFDALAAGQVDCYVDYSGTLWANIMKRQDVPSRATVLEQLTQWLQERHRVRLLGTLGFENTYALAIPKEKSEKQGISTLVELAAHAPAWRIGSDYEFFSRPEWLTLKERYQLRFAEQRTFDPSLMYAAIKTGSVDVISAYSTDGRIVDYNLAVLGDPLGALPPYDAVLLLSPGVAERPQVVKALGRLIGAITNQDIREANRMVDLEQRPIVEAVSLLEKAVEVKAGSK
jgi:osmoprotectant transport system permease protein